MPSPLVPHKLLAGLYDLFLILPLTCLSAFLSFVSEIHGIVTSHKWIINYFRDRVDPRGKAVFVTAGETSLGFSTAKQLSRLGYTIFVGYRDTGDGIRERLLDLGRRVRPVECDVIKYRDVTHCVQVIARSCYASSLRLWAVVCIGSFCTEHFLHDFTIETYEEIIKINALGSARLAKSFVPLLQTSSGKRSNSRLFFVSNISAAVPLPSSICYAMSRASETQFGHTLRKELKKFKISTSIFEPISFSRARQDSLTPRQSLQPTQPQTPLFEPQTFEPEPDIGFFAKLSDRLRDTVTKHTIRAEDDCESVDVVASALVRAITCKKDPRLFISFS